MLAKSLTPGSVTATAVGGPTLVIEYGGLRFITDPTFDPPGSYEPRPGIRLTKTVGPALAPDALAPVDVVLLSHDHHKDNLDDTGRSFLAGVARVLTTTSAAERLGAGATPLANWANVELEGPDGRRVNIMGVPAQHGPDGSEALVGEVTGFVLTADRLPSVYVSGDNASLDVVRQIAERTGGVDIAVLFAGGAQMPYLGDAFLTLPSVGAAAAARILGAKRVIPLHVDGWAHFSEGLDSMRRAFAAADLGAPLVAIGPGDTVTLRL
jgi:L-ascorbate metabolism protein UlaG (beta-lactamase superfamily)